MPNTVDLPRERPRWPMIFPMQNTTLQAIYSPKTSSSSSTLSRLIVGNALQKTPSSIPTPSFQAVTVVPAAAIPSTQTPSPLPRYPGNAATLNQGYCAEPAYTIIDGPTAYWMPVVGCMASKTDCCPTPTPTTRVGADQVSTAPDAQQAGGKMSGMPENGIAEFPISMMPLQGTLTGCPKDYHTVGGTACCPSSYWLWSTSIGGQVPCYSSIDGKLAVPPIPDTLVDTRISTTASPTPTLTNSLGLAAASAQNIPTIVPKPTSAIVNIAYAMQYPMVPATRSQVPKLVAAGIGVAGGLFAVLCAVILWIVMRACRAHKRRAALKGYQASDSMTQIFPASGTHGSPAEVEGKPAARTHEGKKYAVVSTTSVNE